MKTVQYLMPAAALALISCSSTKDFTVKTNPVGADIFINGKSVGKSNLTTKIAQNRVLTVMACKDGYVVTSTTIEPKTNRFMSWFWPEDSPGVRYIEGDEITINLEKLVTSQSYRPTTLAPFTGGGESSR